MTAGLGSGPRHSEQPANNILNVSAPEQGKTLPKGQRKQVRLRAKILKSFSSERIPRSRKKRNSFHNWLIHVSATNNDCTYLIEVPPSFKSILWQNGSPLVYSIKYKEELFQCKRNLSTGHI